MIIKRNIITIFVPVLLLVPMLFTLPFLIIYTLTEEFIAIIPTFICLMLGYLGVISLNHLKRFGNKLIVADSNGISFCLWKVKYLKWSEIEDMKLKKVFATEYLVIYPKELNKTEINLDSRKINISSEDIYSYLLEYWVQANDI